LLLLDSLPQRFCKQAFWVGWWFGFGHFLIGLYWVSFSFDVDISRFFWLIPFSALGLPALLAIWSALATLLTVISGKKGLARCLIFSALWVLGEWLRGHILTGFPWNLIGYIWIPMEPVLQITSIVGIYGLSLITVLLATTPVLFFEKGQKLAVVVFYTFLLAIAIWGLWRLHSAPKAEFVDNVTLRLVQPNISQKDKWDSLHSEENLQILLALSSLPSKSAFTYIIWPEAATPFLLEQDYWHRQMLGSYVPGATLLLLGGLRVGHEFGQISNLWNSLLAIDRQGEIVATYDKSHLVPFGEYIPLRRFVPNFITKVTAGSLDFSEGLGPVTLTLPSGPSVSPLICYEGIFPGAVSQLDQRPQWLLNITNDAWYGNTSGPYQHLSIVRVRAIEEGLPLVRVANTGISAIVDPYGRIHERLGLNEQGVIDSLLPKALSEPTAYACYGDFIFWISLGAILILGFIIDWTVRGSKTFKNKKD
jgi:apolipoprotein N-acyltransferase